MENIKRKQTLPKIPNQMQLLKLAKQKILELPYLSRKFQEWFSYLIGKVKILAKQLNKLGLQNWVKPILNFENQVKHFKIPNKNMRSFIILLGASMNIFIILEMLSAPNKYILEIIKNVHI